MQTSFLNVSTYYVKVARFIHLKGKQQAKVPFKRTLSWFETSIFCKMV